MQSTSVASSLVAASMDTYRFSLGDYEGWIFSDSPSVSNTLQAVGVMNRSDSDVAPRPPSAANLTDSSDLHGSPMLLHWGRELILIDPGCGSACGSSAGSATARLIAAGFSPDDITVILMTHLHLDHLGGAIDDEGRSPRFPQARILACEDEVAFWRSSSPDLSQSALPANVQAATVHRVQQALSVLEPQFELFSAGERLLDQITSLPLPGHTPGHVGFELRSKHEEIIAIGDTFIDAATHIQQPRRIGPTDLRPAMLVETRRTLLRLAAKERKRLFGFHFPFPGFGHIAEIESESFEFVPERLAAEAT
jgi:glyoxylase-like metal-dependent hydrolase (beta-lactamase superfamily II)